MTLQAENNKIVRVRVKDPAWSTLSFLAANCNIMTTTTTYVVCLSRILFIMFSSYKLIAFFERTSCMVLVVLVTEVCIKIVLKHGRKQMHQNTRHAYTYMSLIIIIIIIFYICISKRTQKENKIH